MRGMAVAGTVAVALFGAAVSAQNGPVIPAWVKPGLVLTYDAVSAFVTPRGRFDQPVQILMTTRVTSVSEGRVTATTHFQNVGAPLSADHAWSCDASSNCVMDETQFHGKFWVDPNRAADSVKGPFGEPFRVVGQGPYTYAGKTWDSTMLAYQNPQTGVEYVVSYETRTGLILASSETSPRQQVHAYFRSMRNE